MLPIKKFVTVRSLGVAKTATITRILPAITTKLIRTRITTEIITVASLNLSLISSFKCSEPSVMSRVVFWKHRIGDSLDDDTGDDDEDDVEDAAAAAAAAAVFAIVSTTSDAIWLKFLVRECSTVKGEFVNKSTFTFVIEDKSISNVSYGCLCANKRAKHYPTFFTQTHTWFYSRFRR